MFKRWRGYLLSFALLLAPGALHPQQQPMRIAAAADLQPVLPGLIADFEKSNATKVEVSYASSATLATQILNGAPFDLFLAADLSFPQKVVDANLAIGPQPVPYASGTLVLWARHGVLRGPLSMQALSDASVHRIAVANPQHAPYGAAAVAAIRSLGQSAALQAKLVYAENIAQAAQFAQSGNAECALISKTLAITTAMRQAGSFVDVPADTYPSMQQGAVILRNAAQKQAALAFLNYLLSPAGRGLLAIGGLNAPSATPPATKE
ncbi:MAG: molybdate ABC transporter substrate-binding protein [Acidobacteriaceae bacterium]